MTQDEAFKVLTMGKNVFLTGAAGSGKTHLLNRYIAWLRARGMSYAVTASTGIAATHIGGQTIHSWSGIGIKKQLTEYDIDRIEQDERLVKRFQKTHVLVIDEVSMLSANTLSMVNKSVQAGLQTHEPFGGMQVVLCGDFFQLPPVERGDTETQFAFQSGIWNELSLNTCYLTEQYRQDDTELLTILNEIRDGAVSAQARTLLNKRTKRKAPEDTPHLYTHNIDVDALNNERLSLITTQPRIFKMTSKGSKGRVEALKRGLLVPEELTLKKGAAVMFVKNHPQGLYVNGTLGTITGFTSKGPTVKTNQGVTLDAEPETWQIDDGNKVLAEVTQVPLRLAWAVTIHKSQGLTLDSAYMDLSKTFVEGQGYVALSRVRSLSGLYLQGINELAYARHPVVAQYDTVFHKNSERTKRRLEVTDENRIQEVSKTFMLACGGHEPTPESAENKKGPVVKLKTHEKTGELLKNGYSINMILEERNLSEGTIMTHIEKLFTEKKITRDDISHIKGQASLSDADFETIATAFAGNETWNLTPIHKELDEKYSYELLRIARLFLRPWESE